MKRVHSFWILAVSTVDFFDYIVTRDLVNLKSALRQGFDANTIHYIEANVPVTPLLIAASVGHVECLKLLLQHNANINLMGLDKTKPLLFACQKN